MSRNQKIAALAVAAVLMVVGALVLVGRPKVPHWKEMNAVLDSFPIPAGYHVAERRQAGGYQWFDLPNEHPIAGMTLRPGSESMPPCVALESSMRMWMQRAPLVRPARVFNTQGSCVYSAELYGRGIQAFEVGPRDGSQPALILGVGD